MIIRNSNKSIVYYNRRENRLIVDIDIFAHLVPRDSLDAHISNSISGQHEIATYRPVLDGIYPIPPQTAWEIVDGQLILRYAQEITPKYAGRRNYCEFFDNIGKKYFRKFGDSSVALELSGGLDSTLALVAMFDAGFRPTLIGGQWSNYEFRTERIIQDILIKKYNLPTRMLDNVLYPFDNMRDVPPHILPNAGSVYWAGHSRNVEFCSALGISAVIAGHGGDALLCDPLEQRGASFAFNPWSWSLGWAKEVIYAKNKIRYLSPFAFKSVAQRVVDIRYTVGSASQQDRYKTLFRDLFSDRIPMELSRFHYKASATALHIEGLQRAEAQLLEIFRAAKDVYGDKRLDAKNLKDGIEKYSFMNSRQTEEFEAVISFACWIWSNLKR